jgi:hypothetical protein
MTAILLVVLILGLRCSQCYDHNHSCCTHFQLEAVFFIKEKTRYYISKCGVRGEKGNRHSQRYDHNHSHCVHFGLLELTQQLSTTCYCVVF